MLNTNNRTINSINNTKERNIRRSIIHNINGNR